MVKPREPHRRRHTEDGRRRRVVGLTGIAARWPEVESKADETPASCSTRVQRAKPRILGTFLIDKLLSSHRQVRRKSPPDAFAACSLQETTTTTRLMAPSDKSSPRLTFASQGSKTRTQASICLQSRQARRNRLHWRCNSGRPTIRPAITAVWPSVREDKRPRYPQSI